MIEKINFIRDKLMDRCEFLHTKNVDVIEKKILQLDTRIELFEKSEAFGIGSFEHGEDAEIIHEDLELRQHLHYYQPINIYEDVDRPLYADGELSEITLKQMFGTVISEIRDLSKDDNKRPALKVTKVSMFSCGSEDIVGICPFNGDVAWIHPRKSSHNIMLYIYVFNLFSGYRHQMYISVFNLFSGYRHQMYIYVLILFSGYRHHMYIYVFILFSGSRHQKQKTKLVSITPEKDKYRNVHMVSITTEQDKYRNVHLVSITTEQDKYI
jgi:hypothetical protein